MKVNWRYFAIGLKHWVQIRRAKKPPRAIESKTTVPTIKRSLHWEPGENLYDYGHVKVVEKHQMFPLSMVTFEGGWIVMTQTTRYIKRKLGITVPEGVMIELTPEQTHLLGIGVKE